MATSPTTTIRLPVALKARVLRAAKRASMSPHNFIVDAIAEKTSQEEARAAFRHEAESRFDKLVRTGRTISLAEMRSFLHNRTKVWAAKRSRAKSIKR